MTALAPVPEPRRGSGPAVCCGGHRERCLFGRNHVWATWYHDGRLQRTSDTYQCYDCGGVCIADETGWAPTPVTADPARIAPLLVLEFDRVMADWGITCPPEDRPTLADARRVLAKHGL